MNDIPMNKHKLKQLKMTTPDTDTDSTAKTIPLCPVDRDWISKLILANSKNPYKNGKALVVAPMVDQSDYPFRLLCRQYGANLTFTPMIHASLLTRSPSYQTKFLPTEFHANDRPLIAQLCGNDPDILEEAAKMVLPYCDAIDLNCGCPQGIAKRGFYGAYLLEEEEILLKCVKRLTSISPKPVSVKVRLLYKDDKSIDKESSMRLYQKLVDCGIHLLTVHGRTRHQLHIFTGSADWTVIQEVVQTLGQKIPIFANGNIGSMADVERCFQETGVDGVMSSEAILEYPALFLGDQVRIGRIQLAKEYLRLAQQYPPELHSQGSGIKCLKAHVHRFLHPDLETNSGDHALRQRVAKAEDWQELWDLVEHVEGIHEAEEHKVEEEVLGWYMRHRITVTDAQGNTMTTLQLKFMQDTGHLSNKRQQEGGCYDDEEEPPEQTCFFGDNADDDGDY